MDCAVTVSYTHLTVLKSVVKQHKYVGYECNYYFRVRAKNRIRMVSDKEAFEPWFTELTTGNPLNFPEYEAVSYTHLDVYKRQSILRTKV